MLLVGFLFGAVIFWLRSKVTKGVGFFHPFSDAGGGGERVLWTMINTLQGKLATLPITLFTGFQSGINSDNLQELIMKQFGLDVPIRDLQITPMLYREILDPKFHPFCTLFSQNIVSIFLAVQLLCRSRELPGIIIDTHGLPFCYPIFWLAGMRVLVYLHYPVINSDMFLKLEKSNISPLKKNIKRVYYTFFQYIYSLLGLFPSHIMANSSWTFNHISTLWNSSKISKLYPPTLLGDFFQNDITAPRVKAIISLSQFRPEKNHKMQLEVFQHLLKRHPTCDYKLILIGGARNKEDLDRVEFLKNLAMEFKIQDRVEFQVNIAFSEIKGYLKKFEVGLHTMFEEHFGITLIEFMAAGVIVVASNSGGPKEDIVSDDTGFLALTKEEYTNRLISILQMSEQEKKRLRERARKHVQKKFSQEIFEREFISKISDSLSL